MTRPAGRNEVLSPSSLFKRIPHKREFLARTFRSLGVLRLLEELPVPRRQGLLVFTFHRIARTGIHANPYYDPVISASPETFEGQIQLLASRYQILHLNELSGLSADRFSRSGKPFVLITFDDGYRDNFDVALPILARHGVPATFFIPTGYIEAPRLPWWDHVAYVIKHTRAASFQVERKVDDANPIRVSLGEDPSELERTSAIVTIINQFLAGAIPDESWFLARLGEAARVAVESERLGRELFMGWNEISQLSAAGMTIGSHGRDHLALGQLGEKKQAEQLVDSRRLLEAKLHREVSAIAYPYGWPGTFTARTLELAREAGYCWGFSSTEGINRLDAPGWEPLALRRLNVGWSDSALMLRARASLYAVAGRSVL